MLPTNKLDLAIHVRRHLVDAQVWDTHTLRGTLDDDCDYTLVCDALERCELLGVGSDAATRAIELVLPVSYFKDVASLLAAPRRRIAMPDDFFIESQQLRYPGDAAKPAALVAKYRAATRLFDALRRLADDARDMQTDPTLVWFGSHKLEVTSAYGAADLEAAPNVDEFIGQFVDSPRDGKQKHAIVKDVLLKLFAGESRVGLADVMRRFATLADHVDANYALYVSTFSFQKVMAEVQRQKLAFTEQINGVLAKIQNQLLAVPVAVILAGGQMRAAHKVDLSNVLILAGSLIFTVFVLLMVANQRSTLITIRDEIDRQSDLINTDHRAIAPRFAPVYAELKKRCRHQLVLLMMVGAIVVVAFGFTVYLFYSYSFQP